jgi:hypothetical protein
MANATARMSASDAGGATGPDMPHACSPERVSPEGLAILGALTRQALEQRAPNALNGSNGLGWQTARLVGQGPWT